MRFKLQLEVNKNVFGNRLPINYQYEQSAVIYRILARADKDYATWLHENGYRMENGKTFKFFSYSRFMIEKYKVLLWGIERSGFFNGQGKWAKGFENQMV